MANTFKNAGVAIGTSATTLYTAPAGTTGIIHAIYISNVDGTNDASVDITITDTSAGQTYHIMKTVEVPADSTLVIEKPINLETGDILKVKASSASDLEAFASVLEMN
jgi:hypothetical protein|tara:strand:- start:51 stop:374 length:324 start_codon:yes stop_codon:yes gene_type:complete